MCTVWVRNAVAPLSRGLLLSRFVPKTTDSWFPPRQTTVGWNSGLPRAIPVVNIFEQP